MQKPEMNIDESKIYNVEITTNRGVIKMDLDPQLAPKSVNNFVYLAENGFYDGLIFHRVVPEFVIKVDALMALEPADRDTGGKTNRSKVNTPMVLLLVRTLDRIPTEASSLFVSTIAHAKWRKITTSSVSSPVVLTLQTQLKKATS